jgi:cleavage and polyadenylation specificity factor subunit 4|eukprot:Transcript_12654.p1 GENE.Transcript_12654~~Transcript_12654.p1  ORF type:complete len:242 (-),score=68.31 Transcript_12654:158-883(-)
MDLFDDDDVDLDAMLGVEPDEPEPEPPPGVRLDPRRRKVVCKHWLRGLCKKGDDCDFLHQLDRDRMPECWFFSNFGECSNKDCIFLHLRPEDKVHECPWFARGFCKHGPRCRNRHTRKKPCPKYLAGFCPDGPNCQFGHAKYELPVLMGLGEQLTAQAGGQICPPSGMPPRLPREMMRFGGGFNGGGFNNAGGSGYRDIGSVTCFRCWQKGHYANNCPNPKVPPPPDHPEAHLDRNRGWQN